MPHSRWSRVAEFLGLRRSVAGLLAMVVLVGLGERMADRYLPIYLLAIGGSTLAVGLLNAMENLLGALYSLPGGYLADRWGVKRSLLFFNLLSMLGFLLVFLIPTWQALFVGAILFLSWSAISLPATMSLLNTVLPMDKRTMGASVHAMVKRVPMALGPLLGGACISWLGERDGVRVAFLIAFLLASLSLFLQYRLLESDTPAPNGSQEKNPFRLWPLMPTSLRKLLVADILVRFCEQIPYAFVVIWCMKLIAEPVTAVEFALLTSIEMVTAMALYIPVGWMSDRWGKKWFVLITFLFFTAFPILLSQCQSFWPLVFAFIIRGLKEFGEPSRKTMIMELAPEGQKATFFGLYYLIRDIFVAGGAIFGAILWQWGAAPTFQIATFFGMLGTLWFAWYGQDLQNTPPETLQK
ncbi:MFS transporter [Candidatus Magnetaquicoccus inordinatus]|uniref:MFS transporter n=1 Tax=Candidatus Magnetaquicoccus inordinatus TaxID=2496818 RepID=UPI00102AD3BF|nr:MFS transporter [Candidatus Magnetaquicoccus inordinatus]